MTYDARQDAFGSFGEALRCLRARALVRGDAFAHEGETVCIFVLWLVGRGT